MTRYDYTDTYISKVKLNNTYVIQIVFTDKNGIYEAYSSQDAKAFAKNLMKGIYFFCLRV